MIKIPLHAMNQMTKRGISETDVIETIEKGEIIIEEINSRVGLKKYSMMHCLAHDLIAIWFFNKRGEKEVVTAYWRGRRL